MGCTETNLPHITMGNLYEAVSVVAKIMELVLNNGKCAICGKQIGLTGDPRTFESIEGVRQAFREQVFYWMKYNARGVKVTKENQSRWYPAPFSSSLEGPLQKGIDITRGGSWFTTYGLFIAGLADTADSLGVIDRLIFSEKKVTWDELTQALKANWKGYDNLRQLCINGFPNTVTMMTMPTNGQPGSWIPGTIVLIGLTLRKNCCRLGRQVCRRNDYRVEYGGLGHCRQLAQRTHLSVPSGRYDVPGTGHGQEWFYGSYQVGQQDAHAPFCARRPSKSETKPAAYGYRTRR